MSRSLHPSFADLLARRRRAEGRVVIVHHHIYSDDRVSGRIPDIMGVALTRRERENEKIVFETLTCIDSNATP